MPYIQRQALPGTCKRMDHISLCFSPGGKFSVSRLWQDWLANGARGFARALAAGLAFAAAGVCAFADVGARHCLNMSHVWFLPSNVLAYTLLLFIHQSVYKNQVPISGGASFPLLSGILGASIHKEVHDAKFRVQKAGPAGRAAADPSAFAARDSGDAGQLVIQPIRYLFAARLGPSQTAAVGVVMPIMTLIQAVGMTFGMGAGSQISSICWGGRTAKGEGGRPGPGAGSRLWAIFDRGRPCFLTPLLRLLGATETILPFARPYAWPLLAAAPLQTAGFVLNNTLRSEGNAVSRHGRRCAGQPFECGAQSAVYVCFRLGHGRRGGSHGLRANAELPVFILAVSAQKQHARLSFRCAGLGPGPALGKWPRWASPPFCGRAAPCSPPSC